jgi:N-acetylglucosamine-6-phosphate deacetylase
MTRRSSVLRLSAFLVVLALPLGAQGPEFDLLIRNGHVIDARNGINGVMDVAVAGGKVARLGANIDPSLARRVADATGMFVVPGLIDIHAHVFFGTERDGIWHKSWTDMTETTREAVVCWLMPAVVAAALRSLPAASVVIMMANLFPTGELSHTST